MEPTRWDDEFALKDRPEADEPVDEIEPGDQIDPAVEADSADWVDQRVETPADDDGYVR